MAQSPFDCCGWLCHYFVYFQRDRIMNQPTWCAFEEQKPVVLYNLSLTEVGAVQRLERWLPDENVDYEDGSANNTPELMECLATGTRTQIMYVSLMSVVLEDGCHTKDRFIKDRKFLPISALKLIFIDDESDVTLHDLLVQVYKKISVLFRSELRQCGNQFSLFWFYRSVFVGALQLLKFYSRNEYTTLHTKSLLTIILKQKDGASLKREAHEVHKVTAHGYNF